MSGDAPDSTSEPAPVNLSHSPLVQISSTGAEAIFMQKAAADARKAFLSVLFDDVLDYKHHHATLVEKSVSTLLRIFTNVLEAPNETKFRQLKASGNTFKTYVTDVKGGERLMQLAGWRAQVVDMQRHWVFSGAPGDVQYRVLEECAAVLQKELATIHGKAEKQRHAEEERKSRAAERKAAVLLAIEDDRKQRHMRQELTTAHAPHPDAPQADQAPQGAHAPAAAAPE